MELIRAMLEVYKRLLDIAPKARNLDQEVFIHLERAAQELASALTSMRIRGLLDPAQEELLDKLLRGEE
ncbi:MAG: hypothetical protein DRN15_05830 [Thermoprotei archaeon]|nr:MAG: hypothetical protein DRN15_05830 [Thermoprotei archaeon]RLF23601.1 MAG: hypothetical protein DRM97_04575 [Thermoprotei archaeon]